MTVEEVTESFAGLKVEELHPLSPEVIQRQATINIGILCACVNWMIANLFERYYWACSPR